eukprot:jgi/Tetstr1/445796/TSEL_033442.t1
MARFSNILIVALVALAAANGALAQLLVPTCSLPAIGAFPEVLTVTNFHGLSMIQAGGYAGYFDNIQSSFNSALDGSRPEMAAISEGYVKVYVNNAGENAASNPTTTKTTIYYMLCSVSSTGTETCPTNYLVLGEFLVSDNPFVHITDIADGEYNLKVYSKITTCSTTGAATCPTTYSDSATPLEIPFVVITSPPEVSITSTQMPYINLDSRQNHAHFMSNMRSRFSGKNTDTAFVSRTQSATQQTAATLPVYHTLFQVKTPWTSSPNAWKAPFPDNDDGKASHYLNIGTSVAQGEYTFEVLTMLLSNFTTPSTACQAPATCSSACPSMCLSDFSNLATYKLNADQTHVAYSAAPATYTFVFDTVAPTIEVDCQTGEGKCSGVLYDKKSLSFSFSCTDSNAPCTFYCAIDGKPTLDPSKSSGLGKGYTPCTSPASVHAKAMGSSTFTVYAVDAAGNSGDLSTPYTFYTDNTAPEVYFGGIAKRCQLDERYFVPDLSSAGPASTTANLVAGADTVTPIGSCINSNGDHGAAGNLISQPDTAITGQYASTTCTCGTYSITESATATTQFTFNQGTYPGLMSADSDTSLNAYLGYYPKTVPDKGLEEVSKMQTGQQYLIDGVTLITDSDGAFDFSAGNGGVQSSGYMLYDVGTSLNTTDDITATGGMYDTVVQVDIDITREVYNLPSDKYGAVLATKKVNGNYYYHVLEATNSPNAQVNMVCKHTEIKNCLQSAQNPFQMDCGMLI